MVWDLIRENWDLIGCVAVGGLFIAALVYAWQVR